MKCLICVREDAPEINRLLLSKAALRSGIVSTLAAKIGCSRQVIWKHRKKHLGMKMERRAPRQEGLTLEAKAEWLSAEAGRLAATGGMRTRGGRNSERALRALNVRFRLLQLECQLQGRLSGGKRGHEVTLQNLASVIREAGEEEGDADPEEEERARREFQEVVGSEK